MTTGKELTKADALPSSFEEISSMARAFVASGMFQDTKQLSQAIVKIQAGRELGLPPVYSMQNINMIRDRLTSSANTLAMLVKRSGRYNYRIKEHTNEICAIIFFERDGDKWVEIGTSTFTMTDAKTANLVKADSGWVKFPRAMLFSRAISQGARIYAPDAIGGMYTDEEIRCIPNMPTRNDKIEATVESPPVVPSVPETSTPSPSNDETPTDPTKDKNELLEQALKCKTGAELEMLAQKHGIPTEKFLKTVGCLPEKLKDIRNVQAAARVLFGK